MTGRRTDSTTESNTYSCPRPLGLYALISYQESSENGETSVSHKNPDRRKPGGLRQVPSGHEQRNEEADQERDRQLMNSALGPGEISAKRAASRDDPDEG